MDVLKKSGALGCSLAVATIGLLGTQEAGRTIGDVAVGDVTYGTNVLMSIFHVGDASTAVRSWSAAACADIDVRSWLGWYLLFGVVFLVGYWAFALGANSRWTLRSRGWIRALVIAHTAQLGLATVVVSFVPLGVRGASCGVSVSGGQRFVFGLLSIAVVARWLLTIGLLVHAVWVALTTTSHRNGLRLTFKALGVQRFQFMVAALLAVLFLVPGMPILEQGIDVERSWIIDSNSLASAGWAIATFGLLAIALRYLASVHAAPLYVHPVGTELKDDPAAEKEPEAVVEFRGLGTPNFLQKVTYWCKAFIASLQQSWVWIAASAAVVVIIVLLALTDIASVSWRSAMWIPIVLGAVPVLSAALALVKSPAAPDTSSEALRARALEVGRILSLAVPVILLVSVCRALFAPLMLLSDQRWRCGVFIVLAAVAACALVSYVLGTDAPKPLAIMPTGASKALDPQMVGTRSGEYVGQPDAQAPTLKVPGLLQSTAIPAIVTVLCAVPLLLFPMWTSRRLGVVGTVGFCLLLITMGYMTLRIIAQLVDPPHVFRLVTLRRAPIVELFLIVSLLSTVFAKDTHLHKIRPPATALADKRPTLAAAYSSWPKDQKDCTLATTTAAGRKLNVQPLVMVAAEGGGIRAAWWTVDVMTVLTSTSCGRGSVFLASGVSGGAVGLGMMATADDPYAQMKTMAKQDALAAATEGLLSRDLLAGSFGINVVAVDGPDGNRHADRVGLMEHAWEQTLPGFDSPFPDASGGTAVPWRTVFNGTSVASTCRVLVADVKLTTTTSANCAADGNEMPGAYDLLSAHPCDVGLRTSTASLLAARFPYVTPSGVILGCETNTFADQVIDGGYAENSGIDTVDATLTQLMPAIRATNDRALAAASAPGQTATVIVPVVMFLHNSVVASSSGKPTTPRPKPEVIVPPTNLSDTSRLGDSATLLQRASMTADMWLPDSWQGNDATELRAAVSAVLPDLTMTIAPQQSPQIALPLGWAMSGGTQSTLDKALDAYLKCVPEGTRTCAQSKGFNDLMRAWATTMAFRTPSPRR